MVQLLCTFINPEAAKKVFGEREISESEGFYDDLKAMDPNIDLDQWKEVVENVGK